MFFFVLLELILIRISFGDWNVTIARYTAPSPTMNGFGYVSSSDNSRGSTMCACRATALTNGRWYNKCPDVVSYSRTPTFVNYTIGFLQQACSNIRYGNCSAIGDVIWDHTRTGCSSGMCKCDPNTDSFKYIPVWNYPTSGHGNASVTCKECRCTDFGKLANGTRSNQYGWNCITHASTDVASKFSTFVDKMCTPKYKIRCAVLRTTNFTLVPNLTIANSAIVSSLPGNVIHENNNGFCVFQEVKVTKKPTVFCGLSTELASRSWSRSIGFGADDDALPYYLGGKTGCSKASLIFTFYQYDCRDDTWKTDTTDVTLYRYQCNDGSFCNAKQPAVLTKDCPVSAKFKKFLELSIARAKPWYYKYTTTDSTFDAKKVARFYEQCGGVSRSATIHNGFGECSLWQQQYFGWTSSCNLRKELNTLLDEKNEYQLLLIKNDEKTFNGSYNQINYYNHFVPMANKEHKCGLKIFGCDINPRVRSWIIGE